MDTEKNVPSTTEGSSEDKKSNQIFIRNLSYDVTSDDLLKLFEEHGPVKNVSVVLEGGVSRGFGFVKL
jgi:RNA recognition motif-containing protein